jgi:gas vesicle protein
VKLLLQCGRTVEETMKDSKQKLKQTHQAHGHTIEYITKQWKQKRTSQLAVIETDSIKELRRQIEELVDL